MMKAIAIDDEPPALNVLKRYCEQTDKVDLVKTFTRTNEAREWLSANQPDLLFLDINMPAISGLDFYRSLEEKMMVIMTTAYANFAVEGFNLNAVDYLLKPYSYDRFDQAVVKADEYHQYRMQSSEATSLFVKSDYSIQKINMEDIKWIEAYADYLKIHLNTGKMIITRMTMNDISSKLTDNFMRVHRSYIVPISRIKAIKGKNLTIDDTSIPIGRTYLDVVKGIIK